ncbi:MAG: S41 family peptidase [Bacteroidales bacterium]
MRNIYKFFVVAVLLLPIVASANTPDNDNAELYREINTFNSIIRELNTYYVDTIDSEKLTETALNAMLRTLDPYTVFIPKRDEDDIKTLQTGEYGGIGSVIMEKSKGNVYISEPYKGSPADRAGLRPGDRIIAIDGDSVVGLRSDKISNLLRGVQNTMLSVTVDRPYLEDSILTVEFMREKIRVNPIEYYGVIRDSIGYIKLTTFNNNSAEDVERAVKELVADERVKAIALDLRGNGGGLMQDAIKIVGLFVPKGTMVLTVKGRTKESDRIYKTTDKPVAEDIPLAVIVGGNSASSSEIVAGAIQDLDRGVIIGNRSFGKGLVQEVRPLKYDRMLKLTTQKYHTPSGRNIQAIDYFAKDENGKAKAIPDSLTHEFRTAIGRVVRDGSGVTPDVEVEYPDMNRLTFNIISDNWSFDYATKFRSENESIGAVEDFVITDSIFEDFKGFIDPERFNYDKSCEDALANLVKIVEREGYMNKESKEKIKELELLLKHDLNKDLDQSRNEIERILATDIVTRYYYSEGETIHSLKSDEAIERLVKLMGEDYRFKKILTTVKGDK